MCAGGKNTVHQSIFLSVMNMNGVRHTGNAGGVMRLQQLEKLAEMIGVPLDGSYMYILAWSWSCQLPLSITEIEFMNGMKKIENIMKKKATASTDSMLSGNANPEFAPCLSMVRSYLSRTEMMLHNDNNEFRQFYRFLFTWVSSPETTKKGPNEIGLSVETAVELWRMLFPEFRQFAHLDEWITFCTSKDLYHRATISRDLWEQFLEFTYLEDYSKISVSDAWPSAIDDFVEYFKKLHGKAK